MPLDFTPRRRTTDRRMISIAMRHMLSGQNIELREKCLSNGHTVYSVWVGGSALCDDDDGIRVFASGAEALHEATRVALVREQNVIQGWTRVDFTDTEKGSHDV